MLNQRDYGFSSKNLCVRPLTPFGCGPLSQQGRPAECKPPKEVDPLIVAGRLATACDKVEQQLKDALFARTTAHVGMERILKASFAKRGARQAR